MKSQPVRSFISPPGSGVAGSGWIVATPSFTTKRASFTGRPSARLGSWKSRSFE